MRITLTGLSFKPMFWITLTLGFLLAGLWVQPAAAQESGNITGVVSDPSSAAIPNATVTLTSEATKSKRTTVTDASGTYRIDGVPVGVYDLQVEGAGFKLSAL